MRFKFFIPFFILVFTILSKAEVTESCSSFYTNTTKKNIFIQRGLEKIPVLGIGIKIKNMAKEELTLRRKLTSEQIIQRQNDNELKSLSSKILWSVTLNYLSNEYLGVWGFPPNFDFLNIKKLSNQELELLSNRSNKLSFEEIFKYFGKWKPFLHEAIRIWSFAIVAHTAYGLLENPEQLQQLKIAIQSSVISISTSNARLDQIQNNLYSDKKIRDLALEKWTASFRITEGRDPDIDKYPQDKREWEKVYRQIQDTPIEDLRFNYSSK